MADKNTIRQWAPMVLMMLIFMESSIPMDGGPDNIVFLTTLDPTIQNLLHLPLYGTLAFLWLQFFCGQGKLTKKIIAYSLLITIIYGGLDEVHQSFVRGRYGGLLDVVLNTFGAVLGTLFFGYLYKRKRLKNN